MSMHQLDDKVPQARESVSRLDGSEPHQKSPTTLSLHDCCTRVPHKSVLQRRRTTECPARAFCKGYPQESALQEFSRRVSQKSIPQECQAKVSHKRVLQENYIELQESVTRERPSLESATQDAARVSTDAWPFE